MAYHGTWRYLLWGILESGGLHESYDPSQGHNFGNKPGVYTSPIIDTAMRYARPQALSGDCLYYKAYFPLQVDREKARFENPGNGTEWIFAAEDVFLHELHVRVNDPLIQGEGRLQGWESYLELNPLELGHHRPVDVVKAGTRFGRDEWQ